MSHDNVSLVALNLVSWVGAPELEAKPLEAELRVDEELRRRTDRAGADSAYAAADAAFLPSLADFLR